MKYKIMDGNEACSFVSYKFTELAGIYPITPASPMAEYIDKWSSNGNKNFFDDVVNVTEMQSEAGAIALVHGSLQNGILSTTYTASQGLLLMIPEMYRIAGEMLPCVINVASRSVATHALSIFCDHQDIYSVRPTGFAIFATSSVQQVMDLTSIPYLSTIKSRIPFVNFFDGFRTSHELKKVELLNLDKVKPLIDKKKLNEFRMHALSINNVTRGTNQNDDIYFQITEARNKDYDKLPDIVNSYMQKINKITGKDYKPFDYYGDKNATRIIVAMGSVCETIKDTIDYLNSNNEKVGLIEVHLYRPFSEKYFLDVLPKTTKSIAVLDRTKEPGAMCPLYLDVKDIISRYSNKIKVIGGRYGLSSKDTTPYQIKAVYSYLSNNNDSTFTIGIIDDLTKLSLKDEFFDISQKFYEMLIYGYASDGMVSASKDIIKIIGDNTKAYVQGYFEYDSKKSGGLTKSHLRFGNDEIRATYYVNNPSVVVCTNENYLKKYKMLDNIKPNGIFILNTSSDKEAVNMLFTLHDKQIIQERNIKLYIIDANHISFENELGNKINMIMTTAIFKVANIIPFEFAIEELKKSITAILNGKTNDVIEKNLKAINDAVDKITLVNIDNKDVEENTNIEEDLFDIIEKKEGNSLPVSKLSRFVDGTFPGGLSKYDSKNIAKNLPCYNSDNCIMCNKCSFVCPHGVIRPFLLDDNEFKSMPDYLQKYTKDIKIKDKTFKYIIGINFDNCTGCGLCNKVCPGKNGNKAIQMKDKSFVINDINKKGYEYLFNNVESKILLPVNSVMGSQFVKPKFEFSGACSGCGQTPYLKLLTQLFGNELVISNATGCSSIYGGSIPKTPYSVPWQNSLFEDNAEFGYGLAIADKLKKKKIRKIIYENINKISKEEKEIYASYYKNQDYASSCLLYEIIDRSQIKELINLKEYIKTKSFWIVGGDGWAYDIGFGGLDHVLSSGENINILVLDTEVYSNTGGQTSKSTRIGGVAKFSSDGKKNVKKDLAKIAITYPNVYVATVSLGANMNQTVKAFVEAKNHVGPSIIIAYCPCITHGILNGMTDSINEESKAVTSGYFPLFRYNPNDDLFILDSKANFDEYFEFLLGENRYRSLKKVNAEEYKKLLEENKEDAIKRYNYYMSLTKKEKE